MKKIIGIAMAMTLTICLFSGCGGKDVQPEPTPSPTPAPTAAPTPTPTPEPVAFGSVVQEHKAGYTAASDSGSVYEALSAAWAAEDNRMMYGGEGAVTTEPEDGAVTLYSSGAAVVDATSTTVSDGTHLYVLSGTKLHVLRADGTNTVSLAVLEVGSSWSDTQEGQETTWGGFEKYPTHLYLAGDKLLVLSNWYGYEAYMQDNINLCDYTEYTCLDMYDLTDPAAPVFMTTFGQDGTFAGAQISDGVLYLVTKHSVYSDADANDSDDFLPALYTAQGAERMNPAQIILASQAENSVYALVSAYDLAAASRLDAKALLGANGDVVVNAPSVYLTGERYISALSLNYPDNVYDVSDYASVACTDVYRMELSQGALDVKSAGSVVGHLAGERSVALLDESVHLATREENFRYSLYVDTKLGFENILWGALETAKNVTSLTSQLQPAPDASDVNMYRGYLYNWTEGNFVGLGRDESGVLRLSYLTADADGILQEIAYKAFGSDYSKTLSSSDAIYCNAEQNIIGFAADDGYSFYRYSEENGFESLFDAYITDWPWHVRCLTVGDNLYMTDRSTVYVYSLTDMTLIHTMTL